MLRKSIAFRLFVFALSALALSSCATGGSSSTAVTGKATTKSERASRADDLFTLFDANGDGFLSRAELERGLRTASTTEPNPNLMMALDSGAPAKKKHAKVTRALSDAQVKRAVIQAFKKSGDKGLEERISREEFKKVVAERPANEAEDPWAPFM